MTTTKNRSPHWIATSGNNVVLLQLKATSFNDALLAELGIVKGDASGEVPQGKTQVGEGIEDALKLGCFGLNLVYLAKPGKRQTAKVLVSPSKADTAIVNVRSKQYNGKNIIKGTIPRRRVFRF